MIDINIGRPLICLMDIISTNSGLALVIGGCVMTGSPNVRCFHKRVDIACLCEIAQDSDGNENNTLVVENDKMQQQPSEHKSDGNARVTSRKQEPESKSSFEYNEMNGTSDHDHNLPESAESTAKLDAIQPDHTNPLTSAVSDQEKKRQREAPEKVQLVQSSANQDRQTQNGGTSARLEEEPGSTTAERKNASEDKTEILDSATSAVHSNGSPTTLGKAFQESSNNLPKLKPVSGVGLEHSEAGSNDELEKRAESGTRSDSSSLWHNASSKR